MAPVGVVLSGIVNRLFPSRKIELAASALVAIGVVAVAWRPIDAIWLFVVGLLLTGLGLTAVTLTRTRIHEMVRDAEQKLEQATRTSMALQDELTVIQDYSAALAEFDEETVRLKAEIEAKNAELEVANARLESLATTDPLTGVANHRAMVDALDRELARTHDSGRSFAVLFIDLDHFKALNDSCGHRAGDATLVELMSVAHAALGGAATLGRWGGEEFLAILPEVDVETGLAAAEKLREAVATHAFAATGGGGVTCSIGLAVFPNDADGRDTLVAAADSAGYAAKRLGRNQVRAVSDPAVAALGDTSSKVDGREEAALTGTVEALAALVEARDKYTAIHSHAVVKLAVGVARSLGLDDNETRIVELAARLHDVGKIVVPDSVLQKDSSPLSEEEWAQLRRHPAVGAGVVSHVPALRVLSPLIRSHHERWDGRGYPDGLAGEAIPLGARIVAVADAYRALTAERPYHRGRAANSAVHELRRHAGTQFDARVVEALARELGCHGTPADEPVEELAH